LSFAAVCAPSFAFPNSAGLIGARFHFLLLKLLFFTAGGKAGAKGRGKQLGAKQRTERWPPAKKHQPHQQQLGLAADKEEWLLRIGEWGRMLLIKQNSAVGSTAGQGHKVQ